MARLNSKTSSTGDTPFLKGARTGSGEGGEDELEEEDLGR